MRYCIFKFVKSSRLHNLNIEAKSIEAHLCTPDNKQSVFRACCDCVQLPRDKEKATTPSLNKRAGTRLHVHRADDECHLQILFAVETLRVCAIYFLYWISRNFSRKGGIRSITEEVLRPVNFPYRRYSLTNLSVYLKVFVVRRFYRKTYEFHYFN